MPALAMAMRALRVCKKRLGALHPFPALRNGSEIVIFHLADHQERLHRLVLPSRFVSSVHPPSTLNDMCTQSHQNE